MKIASESPRAPFGAILVDRDSNRLVAAGRNRSDQNPILHGEMEAIDQFARSGMTGWDNLRLYTTAEPCCMCMGAILWARISEVIYGTSIPRLVALGWHQVNVRAEHIAAAADFVSCRVVGGILADECDELFRRAR